MRSPQYKRFFQVMAKDEGLIKQDFLILKKMEILDCHFPLRSSLLLRAYLLVFSEALHHKTFSSKLASQLQTKNQIQLLQFASLLLLLDLLEEHCIPNPDELPQHIPLISLIHQGQCHQGIQKREQNHHLNLDAIKFYVKG